MTHDTRVGAYGVIVREGRILVARRCTGHVRTWTLPGGGLEPLEDPADAAVREVFEETVVAGAEDGAEARVIRRRLRSPRSTLHDAAASPA